MRTSIGGLLNGGDEGDRTPDLCIANAALSQLSYTPTDQIFNRKHVLARQALCPRRSLKARAQSTSDGVPRRCFSALDNCFFDKFLEWSDALGFNESVDRLTVFQDDKHRNMTHVELLLNAGVVVKVTAGKHQLVAVILGKLHEQRLETAAVGTPLCADGKKNRLLTFSDNRVEVGVGYHRDVGHGLHSGTFLGKTEDEGSISDKCTQVFVSKLILFCQMYATFQAVENSAKSCCENKSETARKARKSL